MPRPKRKSRKVRLNLDMPEAVKERLEVLRDDTQADSMSEVVRRALAIYELISREAALGSKFIVKSSDGTERHVEIL